MVLQGHNLEFDPPLLTNWGLNPQNQLNKIMNEEHLENFKQIKLLGEGSVGKVWEVEHHTGKRFAMK